METKTKEATKPDVASIIADAQMAQRVGRALRRRNTVALLLMLGLLVPLVIVAFFPDTVASMKRGVVLVYVGSALGSMVAYLCFALKTRLHWEYWAPPFQEHDVGSMVRWYIARGPVFSELWSVFRCAMQKETDALHQYEELVARSLRPGLRNSPEAELLTALDAYDNAHAITKYAHDLEKSGHKCLIMMALSVYRGELGQAQTTLNELFNLNKEAKKLFPA